jgi:hypothetical protein
MLGIQYKFARLAVKKKSMTHKVEKTQLIKTHPEWTQKN